MRADEPLPVSVTRALSCLRGRFGPLVRFALTFELGRLLVLAPLGAGLLSLCLERWGRCSVGNFEIITFLLSPVGMAGLVGVGVVHVTTFYLEIAGLLYLLGDRRLAWWDAFPAMGKRLPQLLLLAVRQWLILILVAAPFLAAILVLLRVLWAGRDLNGLIVLKPPIFWWGVSAGGCLAVASGLTIGYLLIRWFLALPTLLFEIGTGPRRAMELSAQRMRGRLASTVRLVMLWFAAIGACSAALMGALRLGADWLLDRVGMSLWVLLPTTATVVLLHAAVVALLSILGSAGFASLLLVMYRERVPSSVQADPPAPGDLVRLPHRRRIAGVGIAFGAAVAVVCYILLARVRLEEPLEITAHRGGAAVAPENTVAAVLKAIEARADWAEIDVQRTADGAVVVLHDSDLSRVGGESRRVAESTLAEIRAIDVGSRFAGEFAGERVPTLDEVIAAAGDRIRFNIELKPNGRSDSVPLVDAVLAIVDQAGIAGRCRLCSQDYEGLQYARRRVPGLCVGFIAGGQVGDLSGLDVDFLMVAQRMATRRLAESAGARGMEVHAWTINDPVMLVPLLDRGVANIITDDPAALRLRLEEVRAMPAAERLLLRVRNWLAD